jgi:hypothetical protein
MKKICDHYLGGGKDSTIINSNEYGDHVVCAKEKETLHYKILDTGK